MEIPLHPPFSFHDACEQTVRRGRRQKRIRRPPNVGLVDVAKLEAPPRLSVQDEQGKLLLHHYSPASFFLLTSLKYFSAPSLKALLPPSSIPARKSRKSP